MRKLGNVHSCIYTEFNKISKMLQYNIKNIFKITFNVCSYPYPYLTEEILFCNKMICRARYSTFEIFSKVPVEPKGILYINFEAQVLGELTLNIF